MNRTQAARHTTRHAREPGPFALLASLAITVALTAAASGLVRLITGGAL
jgi:hypothetical protein